MRVGGNARDLEIWKDNFANNPDICFLNPEPLGSFEDSAVKDTLLQVESFEPDLSAEVVLFIPSLVTCRTDCQSDSTKVVVGVKSEVNPKQTIAQMIFYTYRQASCVFVSKDVVREVATISPEYMTGVLNGNKNLLDCLNKIDWSHIE